MEVSGAYGFGPPQNSEASPPLLLTVCAFTGVVAFSYYYKQGCDPLTVKRHIHKSDQILPLFVMEVLAYPGFRGLFIATIFSGALSTISSGVNALAAVTLEDIVKPGMELLRRPPLSDGGGALAAKFMAAGYGLLALALAFLASMMGDTLSAALSLFGMVGGPLLGIFTLAIIFPFANWQGRRRWLARRRNSESLGRIRRFHLPASQARLSLQQPQLHQRGRNSFLHYSRLHPHHNRRLQRPRHLPDELHVAGRLGCRRHRPRRSHRLCRHRLPAPT